MLDVSKCKAVSYTRKLIAIVFDYNLKGVVLEKLACNKTGISFDSKFYFTNHYKGIIAKDYKMYGFIYRNTGVRSSYLVPHLRSPSQGD